MSLIRVRSHTRTGTLLDGPFLEGLLSAYHLLVAMEDDESLVLCVIRRIFGDGFVREKGELQVTRACYEASRIMPRL